MLPAMARKGDDGQPVEVEPPVQLWRQVRI